MEAADGMAYARTVLTSSNPTPLGRFEIVTHVEGTDVLDALEAAVL
jgi:hypothetical protein